MRYEIRIEKQAFKFINKQPLPQKERILKAIYQLPFSGDIKAMAGRKNYFRLRVGDYRIIYTVEHDVLLVSVIDANNRGDIYKYTKQ